MSASASDHGNVSLSPDSGLTQAVSFTSGNPRIEETRGIMHLFHEDALSPHNLPVHRKPFVCVLAVPNHMTYADFCRFCGSFVQYMIAMRIVRNSGLEDQYSVLITFNDQSSTDSFFKYFRGKRFSSLEVGACQVLYALDVQYTGSIEHTQGSLLSSSEQLNCAVCLERLDQDDGAILTTICNHSFHCSCISKWTDSSCPVCRYCQQQPDKSTCFICGISENLWICVICGFVGCGRYKDGHAIWHWKETQHCFSLELETQRVWDYVGDNYVHRLIQSKTDGKLVELNFNGIHSDDTCGSCNCGDSGINEALFNSKFEAIVVEYNDLLTSQLENQRKVCDPTKIYELLNLLDLLIYLSSNIKYYESLLQEAKEEDEREISKAIEKAASLKLQKLRNKLNRSIKEKGFIEDINENLLKNQEIWKVTIQQTEERMEVAVRLRDERILNLEQQLGGLISSIEAQKTVNDELPPPISKDLKDAETVALLLPSSSSSSPTSISLANRSRRRS